MLLLIEVGTAVTLLLWGNFYFFYSSRLKRKQQLHVVRKRELERAIVLMETRCRKLERQVYDVEKEVNKLTEAKIGLV